MNSSIPQSPEPDYRALFESAPGSYLVLTPELRIVAVSDAYLRATMTSRENILGRYLFEVFPDNPDDPGASGVNNLSASLMLALETRKPQVMTVQKYDIRRPNSEGGGFEERYWSPRNTPVLGKDGRVAYVIHQMEDVTELVRLNGQIADSSPAAGCGTLLAEGIAPQEMLARINKLIATRNQLEEQLRQAQKMEAIGRLAGGVAHDFNNLLTVILGYSGILRDCAEDEDAVEAVDQIEKAAGRAAALTTQLLAFSRKHVLRLHPVDLNSLISGMQEFLQRLIGEDISFLVELDPQLPKVKADSGQIEQVIMNLAVNARDAMPAGGRLLISTRAAAVGKAEPEFVPVRKGSYAVLTVSDTGEGMDAATRARIFEPFFTTKASGKGTGLGLSTVFGVVEQSGGTITVSSEPGQGATFTIFLPSCAEAAEPSSEPAIKPPPQESTGTVLLVEDEDSLRKLVSGILMDAGYEVLEASNGAEGLLISHRYPKRIDLLLTDVVMPGLNGPEMAERLQKERPGVSVLFMSGYDQNLMGQNLTGQVNFIAKPFTPRALSETVISLLGKRRASTPGE